MNTSNSELMTLKNIGISSANILHAIGINNYDDLHRVGAVQAYCKIKSRGIPASKVMLYALYGALTDKHWNELSPELKASLVAEAKEIEAELEATH